MSYQPMKIIDIQGVFAETFLLDSHNHIAFISLIGKDTAIQAFRAQWSLPVSQGGITDFQVETEDSTLRLNLGDVKKLQSLSGRLSTQLFGELVQAVFVKIVVTLLLNIYTTIFGSIFSGRSGFKNTSPIGSQFLTLPDQR